LASVWGVRGIGRYVPVKTSDAVIKDRTYEFRFESFESIPEALELPLLTALQEIGERISGIETTYISCKERDVIVQWKCTTETPEVVSAELKEAVTKLSVGSSPLLIEAVLIGFVAIGMELGVYLTTTAVYQITTFVGAQTATLLVQTAVFAFLVGWMLSVLRPVFEKFRE